MGRLDTSYAAPARDDAKQTKSQAPVPAPKPTAAPIITDYASI